MLLSSSDFQNNKKMPKATQKSKGKDEDDVALHRAINKEEAQCYSLDLEKILNELGTNIQDEVLDAMKSAIQSYKETIAVMVWGMDVADSDVVWKAVKDKVSLSICPHTDENEQLLESLVPDEDILTAA